MICVGNRKIKNIYIGNRKVKKVYVGTRKVYSSGGIVTYRVDSGATYTQEYDEGANVLSPTSFTPAKTGYTFVGWREDATASSTVLTSKTLQTETLTLYAVFRKTITVTKYNGSGTASTSTLYQYYNNGSVLNPQHTLTQTALSGWTALGWTTAASGHSIQVANGGTVTLTANATYYGCYSKTVTASYNGNGNTSGSTVASSGTAYYHSTAGTTNASITLRANGFAKSGSTFTKWAISSASGTQYTAGTTVSLSANTTFYAVWATAFYIYNASPTPAYTQSISNGSNDGSYSPASNKPYWYFKISHSGSAYSYGSYTSTAFNRQNCNRVSFTVSINDGTPTDNSVTVGGKTVKLSTKDSSGKIVIDIGDCPASITMALNVAPAGNGGAIQITAPYFYYT